MKELEFIEIIKNTLCDSSYLGDDCALLEEFNIYITQDTLVEDVHFSLYTTSPYFLGRKAVAVNLSDLAAALAEPKYITVSLSLPSTFKDKFVKEFYKGINDICNEYGVKVIGGDITGSDKVAISITAIGKKISEFKSSRSFAQKGDLVVVTGKFGSSSAGFYALSNFLVADNELINSHINPCPRIKESLSIVPYLDSNIAVMDCSDGLVDALYKISLASKHTIKINMDSVPVSKKLMQFCEQNNIEYSNFAKWGGEDFELLMCIPESLYYKLDSNVFTCIGKVLNKDNCPTVLIEHNKKIEKITKDIFISNSFNHFNC